MRLKINIILALLLSISGFAYSQKVLSGKIVDAKTGAPVSYVNLIIKDSHYGTISNAQGDFTFVMPLVKKKGRDTLSVSRIGYKTKDIEINKLRKDVVIKLEPLPVTLKEVGVKGKPTTVKELLKHAWKNYAGNILTDSMVSRHYYVRNYARHNRFFFSEKAVFSTSDNRMDIDSMYAYELKSSCGYLKAHRKELLAVGAWQIFWSMGEFSKYIIRGSVKHWRKAFIDTVYMKDDHVIFVVVVYSSKKMDKPTYRKLTKSVKIDPNWASLHPEAFYPILNRKEDLTQPDDDKRDPDYRDLTQLYIDKTDNYKVLGFNHIEQNFMCSIEVSSYKYRSIGGKMVLAHSQEYSRMINENKHLNKKYYVDKYEEILLTDVTKTDTSLIRRKDCSEVFNKLQKNCPVKAHCFPETTFGEWSKYNSLASDSLDIKVNRDLEELHEKYKKK